MKNLISLTILFVAVSSNFCLSLFDTANSKIEIKGFLDLEESQFSKDLKTINDHGSIFVPYNYFQKRSVKLIQKIPNKSALELKIWGKWSPEAPIVKKNKAKLSVWRSPNYFDSHEIFHSHEPKLDALSGLYVWTIPLGQCQFTPAQAVHLTMPEWEDGAYFLVNQINIVNQKLSGFNVEQSGRLNESVLSQNFMIDSGNILYKFLDEWSSIAYCVQFIVGILLVRYYLAAQVYLILVVFFLIANLWFECPYQSEKFRKSVFLEHSSKLRTISQSGFHITEQIDSKFLSEFESIRTDVKNRILKGSTLKSLEGDLNKISKDLGIEMLVFDGQASLLLNTPEKNAQQYTGKNFVQSLNLIYGLVKESINFNYSKHRRKERQKKLNQKIRATSHLLEGFASYEKILTDFLDNPNNFIDLNVLDTDIFKSFFWGYSRISGSQLIFFLGRRKVSSYKLSFGENIREYLSNRLKAQGYLDTDISLRHRNGSPFFSYSLEDYNFLKLHRYYSDVAEFSHCEKVNGKYFLYFGSNFESLRNYRLLIRVNAANMFTRIINNERDLTHYRLSFLCLPLLAIAISSVIGWRIRKIRKHLTRLIRQGDLKEIEIEGKDQITELTRQLNSILEEPIRRLRLRQLKTQRIQLDDGLRVLSENHNSHKEAIYVVLQSPDQTIPKSLDRYVLWSMNEDFQYYRGWMDYLEFDNFINSLKEADLDEVTNIRQCNLILLITRYQPFDYDSASIRESPQLVPQIDFNFDDLRKFVEASDATNKKVSYLVTNLKGDDLGKLSDCYKNYGKNWKKIEFGSFDGFQLY